MQAGAHRASRGSGLFFVVLAVFAGYALGAAATSPFTWPANVVTAIPIAVVAVLAVVLWPARPDRSADLVDGGAARRAYLGWVVLLAVVVAWELVEYLGRGSRSMHPTLSSMVDALDAHFWGKAVVFLAWLSLGVAIVRAGTPGASRFRVSGTRPA